MSVWGQGFLTPGLQSVVDREIDPEESDMKQL